MDLPALQVAEQGDRILAILRSVMALDLVAARARHARWASAARPRFVLDPAPDAGGDAIGIAGLRHPLLLQVLSTVCRAVSSLRRAILQGLHGHQNRSEAGRRSRPLHWQLRSGTVHAVDGVR